MRWGLETLWKGFMVAAFIVLALGILSLVSLVIVFMGAHFPSLMICTSKVICVIGLVFFLGLMYRIVDESDYG